jgi:hypothetical protein
MRNPLIVGLALAVITPALLNAAVLNVPRDYPSIQEAIDASSDGDTVRVAPGLYFERINFNGRNITVTS